uniref:Sulfatase domain-containing protein n=1 Tax=Mesocestoides corti TaxID=53468 RepID=A0A5K3F3P7_MESCO
MRVRVRRQVLATAFIAPIFFLVYAFSRQERALPLYPEGPSEDCRIPSLVLNLSDSDSLVPVTQHVDCNANGLRFTIEKPREQIDADGILPKNAWLDHGALNIVPESGRFQCDAFPIYRLDEYRSVYGNPLVDVSSGYRPLHPQFMLLCQPRSNVLSSRNYTWDADLLLTQRRFYFCGSRQVMDGVNYNTTAPNVLLLGVDSLSRLAWQRYLPKTLDKFNSLIETRGAVFPKYHVVGDGTTSNLLALLTGHFEQELPESRRFKLRIVEGQGGLVHGLVSEEGDYKGAETTPLDKFPWIWSEFKERGGYVTHFIEDSPNWGTFQYRLQGFGNRMPPVDSYARPCLVAAAQDEARYGKLLGCTASTPTHKLLLESLREFFYANANRPRFSLTFLSEMIHEEPSMARAVDEDLADLLQQIDEDDAHGRGEFANTIVVLFSDHGARMGKARLSLQGKLEERLPMLGILFPRRLAHQWSDELNVLRDNSDRLCSPFDVHATLQHLISGVVKPPEGRGQSLFTPLPRERTCREAGIATYWCTCARWVALAPNLAGVWPSEVNRAVTTTLDAVNSAIRVLVADNGKMDNGGKVTKIVGVCEKLELAELTSKLL